ncbi:DUF222 domain-containing protein [Kribbella sp. NPDC058245]|uniref:HNH endonuclease signature motif containing protein n=1 Tax=Kribbella sp. NPDC058245 TaxID=3346399 RepID=UPI0036E563F5
MEILAMRPVCMQSGSELLTNLDNVHAAKALLSTYELQLAGRLDEMGTAQELGARDTVELVSQRYRLNPADVRKDLKYSGALGKYSAVVEALPDLTDPSHPAVLDPALAKVIVTTLEKAPASVPVDVLEVAEQQMVNAARISNPRELAKFGQEVLARLDTDGAEPAEDEARAKESLRVRQVDGGVKFSGFVAGASGETLLTQLHALSKPHKTVDGERDPRPLEVRQVDGFKTILDAAAGNSDYPGVPHITVTIDFNDLKTQLGTVTEAASTTTPTPTPTPATTDGAAATGSTTTPGTTGGVDAPGATANTTGTRSTSGSARTSGVPGATGEAGTSGVPGATGEVGTTDTAGTTDTVGAMGAVGAMGTTDTTDAVGVLGLPGAGGELVFGGNLSASAVRLLACDAAILPIVLGGDSQPLDVGTEQRFVNRYIRRALNKRDKGCVVCKAPPSMCHAHHLIHWADGGPTSLQNLALLCAVHHRAVHAGQWSVSITDGVVRVTRPAWADPPLTDPAALAAVVAWVTPAHSEGDSMANAHTSNASTVSASASVTNAHASSACADTACTDTACTDTACTATADADTASVGSASTGGASANADSGSANGTAGAGSASVSSDPVHWPPSSLPTASTLPTPEVAAAREAFRTRLRSLVPNFRDPWATDATPGAGP